MNQSPLNAALQALPKQVLDVASPILGATDWVSYQSSGRVLIIGTAEQFVEIQPRLKALSLTVLLSTVSPLRQQYQLAKMATLIEVKPPWFISGYLGHFTLNDHTQVFDMVLDLLPNPLIKTPLPAIGYYHLTEQALSLDALLDEINDRVGQFDKPKYFNFLDNLCGHARNGIQACHQCLDVCSTEAIQSTGDAIEINPYLCQGCGDCASVCPSGAINYNYPSRSETINNIARVVQAFRQAGGEHAVLCFHEQDSEQLKLPEQGNIIPYPLEAVGAAGIDIWLSALALGAAQIYIVIDQQHTQLSRQAINNQVQLAHEILQGMVYSTELIRCVNSNDLAEQEFSQPLTIPPAHFAGVEDKRTQIRMAVDHLHQHCPEAVDKTSLSSPALFGRIQVDAQGCTLCFACVSTCPVGALASGQQLPQLKFIEANCIQCGLCQNACPEQVISLIPEYNYDSIQARRPEILNQEAVFHCIQCDKAFASQSMIANIRKKLQQHPMFQGDNANKLLLCEDCRVTELFK